MTELGPTAKALIDAARDEAGLPPDQRARVRARVLATAGAGGASVFGSLFAKAAAAKLLGSPVVAWAALAVTVAGAGAAYTLAHGSHRPAPVVQERITPAVTTPQVHGAPTALPSAAPSPPTADEAPVSAPGDDVRPRRVRSTEGKARSAPLPGAGTAVARSGSAAPQNADTGFTEDARLLRDVRAALSTGHGERALALLETREANPTSGVFAEEREAAKIVTLCALGRREAPAAAARFLSTHGTSPLAERVRRACPR